MKAPLSWLREYVCIDLPVEELASRLTLTGTEVERIAQVGIPGDPDILTKFVVGKVLDCQRHPNADKLSVCIVDVGGAQPRTIVCGAPNVAAGQTVAVVLPGGVMPDGTRIREAKLRGVESSGMILSEAELGLAAKSSGIMELPDSWQAGELLADHFRISDQVLEVEITPNRPDCLSIRGMAREIAAVTRVPFDETITYPHPWGERPVDADLSIEVRDPDLCPRYAARIIRGVTVAESPLWLKARVCHAGMRPVNNVVDVTNYVLWALGQPLHAFDLKTVKGGRIIVRRAEPGEKITTLDGQERVLTEDMLVIADAERASVVAGIMGGLDSEVTESTTDILLEGANFAAASILRTSSALGLRSEASTRYEKGLDPEMIPLALDLACKLLVEVCGGVVSVGTIDARTDPRPETIVDLRPSRVEQVLGAAVDREEMVGILMRLGCAVEQREEGFRVYVPTFRADLEREIDLIEEIARIHGLERIPSTLPARRVGRGGLSDVQAARRRTEDLLVGCGLTQVITYSFGDDKWADRLRLAPDDSRRRGVRLANPLSVDQSVMRTMLLPGLLGTAKKNISVRETRVHVFEIGRVFPDSGAALPQERIHLGVLLVGPWEEDAWLRSGITTDYFLGKGVSERLSEGLGVRLSYLPAKEPFLHPGKNASIIDDQEQHIGWVGELHPLVLEAFDIRAERAVAAELDLDRVLEARVTAARMFTDLLAYPVVEQDIALVVDASIPAAVVLAELTAAGGDLLEKARVFDVYEGPQVGEGKKSLAIRLSFRSSERTLSEVEVNEIRSSVVERVASSLGAQLRS
jgi:phenylalanyl-tRNA synthetase beta chain